MSKALIGALMGLAVAAILITGCGGSSDSSSSGDSGGSALTKQEYVRKGNAICGEWQQARAKLFSNFNTEIKPPYTDADREKAILQLIAAYEGATKKLGELPSPSGDEKKVDAIVESMEAGIAKAKSSPLSLMSSDFPFNKPNEVSKAYGLKECKF